MFKKDFLRLEAFMEFVEFAVFVAFIDVARAAVAALRANNSDDDLISDNDDMEANSGDDVEEMEELVDEIMSDYHPNLSDEEDCSESCSGSGGSGSN